LSEFIGMIADLLISKAFFFLKISLLKSNKRVFFSRHGGY